MMFRGARFALILVIISVGLPNVVFAGETVESPVLVAELEGVPIPATAAGEYFCHDFDYPLIRCFRSGDALEAAVEARGVTTTLGSETLDLSTTAVSYVKIYDYTSYAGSYAYISQDYSYLGDIGWNDRISSYIALNSETGAFYTNGGYGGTIDYFCCNEGVPSLSSTFNNQISSVRRT